MKKTIIGSLALVGAILGSAFTSNHKTSNFAAYWFPLDASGNVVPQIVAPADGGAKPNCPSDGDVFCARQYSGITTNGSGQYVGVNPISNTTTFKEQ